MLERRHPDRWSVTQKIQLQLEAEVNAIYDAIENDETIPLEHKKAVLPCEEKGAQKPLAVVEAVCDPAPGGSPHGRRRGGRGGGPQAHSQEAAGQGKCETSGAEAVGGSF